MSLIDSTEQAVEYVEHLQTRLWDQGDHSMDDDLTSLLAMMESPLFRQILNLQESLQELKQVTQTYPVTEDNFEITYSGQLILNMPPNGVPPNQTLSDNAAAFSSEENLKAIATTPGYDEEFQKTIERVAKGREVETIKLFKPENMSLGFSVVGLKGENNEETGIFVQDIQPGGIAARDGRLREQDQILAIDGQPLDISHQEAIRILQSARGLVVLIIARGYQSPQFEPPQLVNEPVQGSAPNVQAEVQSEMVLNTEWTQIEVIDLENDGSGLGFGIFGGRSSGVIVKTILPGGVACRNGQLHSGDHILQIGDVNVRGMSSEQVAAVLRQSGREVRLIVARPVNEPSAYPTPHTPVVPTHQLDEHLQQINALLHGEHINQHMADELAAGMIQVHMQPGYNDVGADYPEVEYFDVTLMKDSQGLGITIAGYVGKDNTPDDLCGIFVKSVADCSAAAKDGRIQVNDQIIKVDNQPLHGFTNHQAVEVLRNTGQMVHLQLARFQHGPKYEKLQQYLAQPPYNPQQGMVIAPPPPSQMDGSMISPMDGPATIVSPMIEQPTQARMVNHVQQTPPTDPGPGQQVELQDITLNTDEDYSGDLSPDIEEAIKACWEPIVGSEFEVVVAQLSKFREGGGLGISLEGTVDVEKGVEVRPHHYIRFILSDGPVGINGRLKSGDELLEVNGRRLLGLNHKEVVGILKELPQHVRLVCARHKETENYTDQDKIENGYSTYLQSNYSGVNEVSPITERLVKAKSENTLASTDESVLQQMMKNKSRSLEELTNFKMWSIEPVVIELCKGDKGLGFSILDYKDPENLNKTVIVIKSLVPGGVAQVDGRLLPGDRLIFVNDEMLENASLDEAVNALKGAPKGIVRIGVKKALPLGGIEAHQQAELQHSFPFTNAGYPAPSFLPSPPSQPQYTSPDPVQRKFTEQYSSNENVVHKQTDSFYESDDEVTSPRKNKPVTSPRRSLDRRKRESTGSNVSYENSQVLLDIKNSNSQKETVQKKFPVPQPRSTSALHDYVNNMTPENLLSLTQEKLPADSKSPFESPRSESPADYENTTFALPTYEEATSGDLQPDFFNMNDLDLPAEAPPVPPRSESQEELFIETEQSLNHTPPDQPSDFEESPRSEKGGGSTPKRTPPPIPPKPKVVSPKVQQIVVKSAQKDSAPPPLPVSLPPALDEQIDHTEEELSIKIINPKRVRNQSKHQKTASVDSQQSSSSDQPITSDLTNSHSPSIVNSTNHITSPSLSPLSSPRLARTLSGGADSLPVSLEKVIKIKKSRDPLGLTVEAVDKGANGCTVKTMTPLGAFSKDGRVQQGDYIVSINNESMRRITSAQARAIIRRASLQGLDVSVSYISKEDAAVYQETAANAPPTPPHPSMMPSPKANLSPLASPRNTKPDSSPERSPVQKTPETVTPRVKSLTADGSPATGNQTWGPPRTVELEREQGKSLGISIVGGRVDMFNIQMEHIISGIFIKHVLEDSPAGRNGTLKTGDRILEVDGKDLRNAAHDQAVDIIRHAKSPVKFVVQSLCDPACPRDLENDTKSVHSYDEASLAAGQTYQAVDVPLLESVVKLTKDADDSEEEDEFGYTKKKIQRQYGDLNGDLHVVDLNRGHGSLGINLAGNKDRNTMSVFVAGVQPEGIAGKDGRIQVGDELLEVNGQVLYGRSHLNASAIIKSLSTNVIKFVLLRRSDNLEHMAVKPLKMTAAVSHEDVTHSEDQDKNGNLTPLDVIQVVTLEKGASGLGFAIVEEVRDNQPGIFIRSITPGGVAAQDGQLSVGDQILEVGDKPLTGVHYEKAIEILRNMQGTIKLKVRKNSSEKKLSFSNTNHLDPEPGTKSVFQLQSAPGESSTDPNPADEAGEEESADPKTCPIIPGRETTIEIEKGRTGLGLSIVGGADTLLGAIIVHEVYEEGAAARDGRLWAGDQILEVNYEDLKDATHDYAIQVLRQTPSTVQIKVFRDDSQVKEEDIYDIFSVELTKKPGRGLGLSIVGKRNDVGVYISDIVKGGTAEADGRLMQGDQILAVNKEDMRNATQEYAAAVLKTLMGKVSLTVGRLKAGSRASSRKNSTPGSALKKSESSVSNKSKGGKHSKSHSEDLTHIRVVELEHDITGSLGLSIAGGIGSSIGDTAVIIANMTPAGPAAKSQKLKIGDQILSINDVQLDGMSHDEVVQLLKKPGTIKLTVSHGEETRVSVSGHTSRQVSTDMSQEYAELMAQDNVFQETLAPDEGPPPQCNTLHLNKGPEGLGFSIVGGHGSPHGDLPIYVKSVFSKGAAADEGSLKRGDQIISVNGQSLEGCTHDEAVSILKNTRGAVTMTVLTS
eukprot:XP_011455964.1 PREDICTED: multiple PDZ domain protein isoform X3 [Crassostrea gigas]